MTPVYWLVLDGPPVRQFYKDNAALAGMDTKLAKFQADIDFGTLRQAVEGENVNSRISIPNEGFELSRLYSERPPLGQRARVFARMGDVTELVFTGLVQDVSLDDNACVLGLEA